MSAAQELNSGPQENYVFTINALGSEHNLDLVKDSLKAVLEEHRFTVQRVGHYTWEVESVG